MKTTKEPKTYSVKALRGFVGEDGKNVKTGATVTCKRQFAKTLSACGRGEIIEDK